MSDTTHEIVNVFLTLNLQISNIEKTFPAVIGGYRDASTKNLIESPVPERQLEWLQASINGLRPGLRELKELVNNLQAK